MKITKKQIEQGTITDNYQEMKNVYIHRFEHENNVYECRTYKIAAHLTRPEPHVFWNDYQIISSAHTKKEFIHAVWHHINS